MASPVIAKTTGYHPFSITYETNPSREAQMKAVLHNPHMLAFMKHLQLDPTIPLAAVSLDGLALQHITNPSEEIILSAVKQNGRAIRYTQNPSPTLQMEAVSECLLAFDDMVGLLKITPAHDVVTYAARQGHQPAIEYARQHAIVY